MKRYRDYMDSVTAPDTLKEKLRKLEPGRKRPPAWQKYGALAAALVLVVGLGAWGLSRMDGSEPAIGEIGQREPDIAPAPNPMPDPPGMEMLGGYEVVSGEIAAYYSLPAIRYYRAGGTATADIACPEGVNRRDLTEEELRALLGGEENIAAHLDWEDYDLAAWAMVYEDGSLWMLGVSGYAGPLDHFELDVMPGAPPPACIVYPGETVNQIWGVDVSAVSHDGQGASSRRVSFLRGEYGYRFDAAGTDGEALDWLVSRLVRFIVVGDGLKLAPDPVGVPDPGPAPTAVPTPEPEPTVPVE